MDVVDLRAFYHGRLGQVARRILRAKLRARFADVAGLRVLGAGFAAPFLGIFRDEAERVLAFMPAEQGVMDWQSGRGAASALVEEEIWPLPDAAVDRIVLIHALENADNPREVLRECWRCLAPGGKLIVVVPNRQGAWSRLETTPFGHGRPYSRSQLTNLLREAQFAPVNWTEALMFPPIDRGMVVRSAVWLERVGASLWAPFAGVHMVEAIKQVYTPVRAKKKAAKVRKVEVADPVLVPGGAVNTRQRR
ncbi:methyltransferase type 11 [Terrihabitans soli]|uniref:Methyltransferase type 11 n=2 Tax=Terrihabitans soli TaxID=708113 RepID=A0A6S6QEK2_9HYPH|nr:methyltransferase type 11 [Terrihabitans soli]